MGLHSWIRGAFSRARALGTPAGMILSPDHQPGRISDGVPYALPVIVPYAIREDAQAVREFTEAVQDEFKHQFGTPFVRGGPFRIPTIARPLEEWTQDVRQYILEQCHLAWERNPIAKTAVFYNRAFSVQNGASISYKNKQVEDLCRAFIDDPENSLRDLEKTTADGLFVDGEAFFRFFQGDGVEGEAGQTKIAPLVPWGVVSIKHQPGFWRRVEHYRYRLTQDTGDPEAAAPESVDEAIPASDVLHIAINRLSYERRGRPDLFAMLPWLQAHKEWLENRARQNYWRGAILFWIQLLGATPAQVRAKLDAYRKPATPGSNWVTNDKEEITQFSPTVGASDAGDDGRQLRAMAATGARLPESWLSDGADANLATAQAQALPAVTSFGEMQDIMREKFWTPILRRVIQNAIDAGTMTETVPVQDSDGEAVQGEKPVKAIEAFDVTYSELGSSDPKNVVEAVLAAMSADVLSVKTARGLMPWELDHAAEEKQIRAEREQHLADVAAGLIQLPLPFGQNGNTPPGQPGTDEDTDRSENGEEPSERDDERPGPGRSERPVPKAA